MLIIVILLIIVGTLLGFALVAGTSDHISADAAENAAKMRRSVTLSVRSCDSTMVVRAASKSIITSSSLPRDANHKRPRPTAKPY